MIDVAKLMAIAQNQPVRWTTSRKTAISAAGRINRPIKTHLMKDIGPVLSLVGATVGIVYGPADAIASVARRKPLDQAGYALT
jgi:hypothetical protein